MSTTTPTHLATQVYQIFIKATPEQIWDAITKPEFTARYFHGARITVTSDHYGSLGPDDERLGRRHGARCSTRRASWCTAGDRCTTRR